MAANPFADAPQWAVELREMIADGQRELLRKFDVVDAKRIVSATYDGLSHQWPVILFNNGQHPVDDEVYIFDIA